MIVEIRGYDFYKNFKMCFDLQYVVDQTGKREWWMDHGRKHYFVPFTKNHAKRIFKLIKLYGTDETIAAADHWLKAYKDIYTIWEKA